MYHETSTFCTANDIHLRAPFGSYTLSKCLMYFGDSLCRGLFAWVRILYIVLYCTGSQWSCLKNNTLLTYKSKFEFIQFSYHFQMHSGPIFPLVLLLKNCLFINEKNVDSTKPYYFLSWMREVSGVFKQPYIFFVYMYRYV